MPRSVSATIVVFVGSGRPDRGQLGALGPLGEVRRDLGRGRGRCVDPPAAALGVEPGPLRAVGPSRRISSRSNSASAAKMPNNEAAGRGRGVDLRALTGEHPQADLAGRRERTRAPARVGWWPGRSGNASERRSGAPAWPDGRKSSQAAGAQHAPSSRAAPLVRRLRGRFCENA